MTSPVITDIAKARSHDTWLYDKLAVLEKEYGELLDDHHRLVRENSKLRMTMRPLHNYVDFRPASNPILLVTP